MKSRTDDPAAGDLAECAQCLCLASRRAARTITRSYDRHLRPFGIRATQFSALVTLALRGPLTIGELARSLGSERTTLTRNLALIEKKGWIRISVGDDARARVVTMTSAGRAAVLAARQAWGEAQHDALAALGPSGASALRTLSQAELR